MRLLFSGVLAAGLLASQVASAVECPRLVDSPAFDVEGLKTELMYIALTCDARDQYNAFINKYKTEINADEKTIGGHFNRTYGRNGTHQHDEFITNLANTESQGSMRQGSAYCGHNVRVFNEVMQLRNNNELEQYAAGRASPPPALVRACTTAAPVTRMAATTRRRTTKR